SRPSGGRGAAVSSCSRCARGPRKCAGRERGAKPSPRRSASSRRAPASRRAPVRAALRSFAKVDLHLQVVGGRGDGYYELRTVFQSIDWCDRIEVELAERGVELAVSGASALSAGADNLARRAAESFLQAYAPRIGARLALDKRLPLGGGLGG